MSRDVKSVLALAGVVIALSLGAFSALTDDPWSEEESPHEAKPVSDDFIFLSAAVGVSFSILLGVALFRAFTPPEPPYVVEYDSPKIDPEELRNL
jgi:hypothetical protein